MKQKNTKHPLSWKEHKYCSLQDILKVENSHVEDSHTTAGRNQKAQIEDV